MPIPNTQPTTENTEDVEIARANRDYVFGATKSATVIFPVKETDPDFNSFRRKTFRIYEHWKAGYYEARKKGRPLPSNPGFVIIDGCAQIILSRSAHRAYLDSQRGGRS
jgi:hypothetical protein